MRSGIVEGHITTSVGEGVFAPARNGRRRTVAADTNVSRPIESDKHQSANVDEVLNDSFPASDPPSWSGAISRVAATSTHDRVNDGLIRRARAEFLEMPGLCLTMEQAQRLWSLEPRTCHALLNALIDSRFLRRTDRGLFVLCRPRG